MKNKKLEANLSMAVSKVFSGLNMNALKYLLPLWMSPLTGATLRCTFAAAAFLGDRVVYASGEIVNQR